MSRKIEIFGEIKRETELAIRFFDGTKTVWLPKSQIEYDEPNPVSRHGMTTVEMPEWLAIEKELV